jgi:hypothetical protein
VVKKTKRTLLPDELAAQDLELERFIDANGPYDSFGDIVSELERPEYDHHVRGEPWRAGAAAVHRHWVPRATEAHRLKALVRRFELPWLEAVRQIHRDRPTMKKHGVAMRVSARLKCAGHPVSWKTLERWIDALGGLEHIGDRWV